MYKNILLPVDLESESSWKKALPTALDFTRDNAASLHVMTVVPQIVQIGAPMMVQYFPAGWEDELIKHAEGRMSAFLKEHIPADFHVTHSVLRGSIYGQILDTAEESKVDLIIMASHRPELKDYLIGPNATHVVRHANCSVFVVRG